jgi:hypothetical protein
VFNWQPFLFYQPRYNNPCQAVSKVKMFKESILFTIQTDFIVIYWNNHSNRDEIKHKTGKRGRQWAWGSSVPTYRVEDQRFKSPCGQAFLHTKNYLSVENLKLWLLALRWKLYLTYVLFERGQASHPSYVLYEMASVPLVSIWVNVDTIMLAHLRSFVDKSLNWTSWLPSSVWH